LQCTSKGDTQVPFTMVVASNQCAIDQCVMAKVQGKNRKNPKKNLMKRAKAKYVSRGLVYHLTNGLAHSPLMKAYTNSWYCADTIVNNGEALISYYCKNRWCPVCNRIRTGQIINGYKKQLESEIKDPQFVTLTTKTVSAKQLRPRMDQQMQVWGKITIAARVRRQGFLGIRKWECTHRPGDLYHPHFHVIVSTREHAEWLVKSWMRHFKGQATRKAQDIRPANSGSFSELFKYATKTSVKPERGPLFDSVKRVPAEALDVIFRAMKGRRLYQPFGGLRRAQDDLETDEFAEHLFGQAIPEGITGELWTWKATDWLETTTGQALTKHVPSDHNVQLWGAAEKAKPPDKKKT